MNKVQMTAERYARLDQFLGYGRLDAPIGFFGLEERTRIDDTSIIENDLRLRERFEAVMDL